MNYGGSQLICSGERSSIGTGTLNFVCATLKGYQDILPRIATDLAMYIFKNNVPFDPFYVKYSIYDLYGKPVKNQVNVLATRFEAGHYYANYPWWTYKAPRIPRIGKYTIVWEIKEEIFWTAISTSDEFSIYRHRIETGQATHVASTGCNIDNQFKQSGTYNTLAYGIGLATLKKDLAVYNGNRNYAGMVAISKCGSGCP